MSPVSIVWLLHVSVSWCLALPLLGQAAEFRPSGGTGDVRSEHDGRSEAAVPGQAERHASHGRGSNARAVTHGHADRLQSKRGKYAFLLLPAPADARPWKTDVPYGTLPHLGGPKIPGIAARRSVKATWAHPDRLHFTPLPSPLATGPDAAQAKNPQWAWVPGRPAAQGDDGIAFDYREKYPNTSFAYREMAAFYVHRLNQSWKTRAFLSRGFHNGGAEWRGGMALGYDF